MADDYKIELRYYRLPVELGSDFSFLYFFDIENPGENLIEDRLHPSSSCIRFTTSGAAPAIAIVPNTPAPTYRFAASGPISRAINFGLTTSRSWGLGMHPLGWSRFTDAPASEMADKTVDAEGHSAFARFAPIMEEVLSDAAPDEIAQRIERYLLGCDRRTIASHDQILACQRALNDPEIADVAMLAEAVGVRRRTLERLCLRHFGFSPKMLLRRQRFQRSLARFLTLPIGSWSEALDGQYFDQAHFVREFRAFMGITPTQYAEAPHPFVEPFMARHAVAE